MNQRKLTCFIVILFLFGLPVTVSGQKKSGLNKVVIDAGHGGHDPGTLGKKSREKDIALSVALRFGKLIQEKLPDVEVIYTRKTDVFIELFRRSQIANDHKADLFISIHCNSTTNPVPRGVETWVMGLHKSRENLEVAKKENASILMEDNYTQYDGFDPNSPEANIIFSLFQNTYLDQSLAIASKVQSFATQPLGLPNRGVKQAGFWVLYKTSMPGILIETGFLSNPEDEDYLITEKGQDEISNAIFLAFKAYKENCDGGKASSMADFRNELPAQPKPVCIKDSISAKPLLQQPKEKNEPKQIVGASTDGVVYRVQILSDPKKLSPQSSVFKGVKNVESYQYQGAYKYVSGSYPQIDAALKAQSQLRASGFKDAFVVAFYKGERITIAEAKQIMQK